MVLVVGLVFCLSVHERRSNEACKTPITQKGWARLCLKRPTWLIDQGDQLLSVVFLEGLWFKRMLGSEVDLGVTDVGPAGQRSL